MKPGELIAVLLIMAATLVALIGLPATELIPAQVEHGSIAPGLSPVRVPAAMDAFKSIGEQIAGVFGHSKDLKPFVEGDPKSLTQQPGELKVYAMWAVFLSIAMTLSALAYCVLGHDPEEKLVLPVKK